MKKVLSICVMILCVTGFFSAYSNNNSHAARDYHHSNKSINPVFLHPLSEIAPKATDDNFVTSEDVVLNNTVATNDTISPDGINEWTIVSLPTHGVLVFNNNGTFQYTPGLNFYGTDTFTYQLCDIDGDCDTALVTITISPVNEFPVALSDSASLYEDGMLSDSVTANDILSADGGNMWGTVTGPFHGAVIFNTDGSYTYTPGADFYGMDSIIYKIYDVDNDSAVACIYLTVLPINDKPGAIDDNAVTAEDTPVTIDATANDNDVDGNLYFSAMTVLTLPGHGTATINALTGDINYTPNPNYNGNDTLEYCICDDGTPLPSLCDTAFIYIVITPVNDLPVANTDNASTNSYTPVTINVLYNDTFGGDGTCACAITATNGAHGTTSVNNNGTATNPADDRIVYTPNASYHGTDSFTYTISDIDGEQSTATVYMDVTSMFAPTLTAPVNGAAGQMPNALISWNAVPGAFHYKAQVSTDSLFTTNKVYTTNLSAVYTDNLLFNTIYYWRVKAYGVNDSTSWSGFFKFKVLKTVTITQPANGSMNNNLKIRLRWNAISGLTKYEYQIDSSTSFSSPLLISNAVAYDKTTAFTNVLVSGTNYHLRMRALHNADTSEWSELRDFTTLNTFDLIGPQNSAVGLSPVTEMSWDWTGASKYELALSTDSLFSSAVYSVIDSNDYTVYNDTVSIKINSDTLRFGQKYFWKVRNVSALGNSAWTATWKFTTVSEVTLVSPADGAVDISRFPIFKWTKINNIGAYHMEIDDSPSFSSPIYLIINKQAITDTLNTQLQPLTVYHWRMRAVTHVDSTEWCAPFQFRTAAPIGIENNLSNDNISIYPNPSSNGKINIQIPAGHSQDIHLSVVNMIGQEIYGNTLQLKPGNNLFTVNLQRLSSY